MCRETCVYSATVRDVLTLWRPVEFKGLFTHIKNNPKYNTKAFDTCDVDILLSKLELYGFRGTSNVWFKNYLYGRKQFASIRGVDSSLKEISCGVPQGRY